MSKKEFTIEGKIIIVGDTHVIKPEDLPNDMIKAINEADLLIHIGDFISEKIIDFLISKKGKNFVGVYGNADPLSIRNRLQERELIKVNGLKIGITHPALGGSEKFTLKRALALFRNDDIDVLVYGHTHDPYIDLENNPIIINPGRGFIENYSYDFGAFYAIIDITKGFHAKIEKIL
ncbi:MAG: YfcE family phosphodiesterase [Promethearchaeota archaeon]